MVHTINVQAGSLQRVDVSGLAEGSYTVQVRNGTGTENQATDVTGTLSLAGFSTLVPGADGVPGFPTVIQYALGSEAHARVLASWIEGPVTYQQAELPEGVDAILVTGADWAGTRTEPRPYSEVAAPTTTDSTTSTTAPDPAAASTTPVTEPEVEEPGDVDDPDTEAFYRATVPPPGSQCQPTD